METSAPISISLRKPLLLQGQRQSEQPWQMVPSLCSGLKRRAGSRVRQVRLELSYRNLGVHAFLNVVPRALAPAASGEGTGTHQVSLLAQDCEEMQLLPWGLPPECGTEKAYQGRESWGTMLTGADIYTWMLCQACIRPTCSFLTLLHGETILPVFRRRDRCQESTSDVLEIL